MSCCRVVASAALAISVGASSAAMAQTPESSAPPPVPREAGEPEGLRKEPSAIRRGVIFGERHITSGEFGSGNDEATSGVYLDFDMIPGAGWISGGPGYRRWYARDRVFIDVSTVVSWRGYKMAHARFELPTLARSRLALGSELRWQDFTQVSFFGSGADSLRASRSEYRVRSTNLVGYATLRPVEWLGIGGELGWLQPSILARAGTFKRDRPDARDVFPDDRVFARDGQPAFVHTGASITADTRDFPNHPTRGGVLRGAVARYADRETGTFSFRRYEAEAAGFVPVAERVVIAGHGWLVTSDTGPGQFVPFYLQPSLGGHNTLRSYPDYRFHDRNLVLVNGEVRVAMMTHVDLAGFVDAGNVGARVADLNFDRKSYGAGLRLHSRRQTFARLDLAHGREGWRLAAWVTDPLKLTRIKRRAAAIPFVP